MTFCATWAGQWRVSRRGAFARTRGRRSTRSDELRKRSKGVIVVVSDGFYVVDNKQNLRGCRTVLAELTA